MTTHGYTAPTPRMGPQHHRENVVIGVLIVLVVAVGIGVLALIERAQAPPAEQAALPAAPATSGEAWDAYRAGERAALPAVARDEAGWQAYRASERALMLAAGQAWQTYRAGERAALTTFARDEAGWQAYRASEREPALTAGQALQAYRAGERAAPPVKRGTSAVEPAVLPLSRGAGRIIVGPALPEVPGEVTPLSGPR